MIFHDQTYAALVVSANDRFTEAISKMLPPSEYWPVVTAGSVAEAGRKCKEQAFDVVLVNTPLPDDFGLRFAAQVTESGDASVLVFCRAEVYEEVSSKAAAHGILTISKPVPTQFTAQILRAMCAMRERVRSFEKKQATVEKKIEDMRIINRAKWLLIECLSMTEADAHRYIEKQAMDMRVTKREVADTIIRTYS